MISHVAFATAEELRSHHQAQHSARMPRWDPSRARVMPITFIDRRARATGPASGPRTEQPSGRRRGGGGRGSGAETGPPPPHPPAEAAQTGELGWRMIDDDLDFGGAEAFPEIDGAGAAAGGTFGGTWVDRGGAGREPVEESFPSLAAAAGPSRGPAPEDSQRR